MDIQQLRVEREEVEVVWGDGRGVAGAPTLVLLHGAGGTGAVMGPLCDALAPLRACAPTLPGRAGSTGTPRTSIEAMAAVVVAVADALALPPFVVMGHSMGGAIAQELALRCPARLHGLALVSTGARLRVAAPILDYWRAAAERGVAESTCAAAFQPGADFAEVARVAALELAVPPATTLCDWEATHAFDRVGALDALDVPTVVVSGDADLLTPPKYARYLAEHLKHARLVLVPGAGHLWLHEHRADAAQLLRDLGITDLPVEAQAGGGRPSWAGEDGLT